MSNLLWVAQKEVAYVSGGSTTKTGIQIISASNQKVLIKKWELTMRGTVRNAPAWVEVIIQTTAGTGGTSLTLSKWNALDTETLQTTALYGPWGAGTEPTGTTLLWSGEVSPDGDRIGQNWLGLEFQGIPMAGGTRLGWRITAANDVTYNLHIVGAE